AGWLKTRAPRQTSGRSAPSSGADYADSRALTGRRQRQRRMGRPSAWLHLLSPPSQHQHITLSVSRMCERRLYGMEEILLAAGFIQKGHRAGGKGARAHVVIGIRRDEDDRHGPVRRHELTLELEAVHARQAHIEKQARR